MLHSAESGVNTLYVSQIEMGGRKQKGIRQGRWLTYHLSHYLKQWLSAAERLPAGPEHIHTPAERESVEQRG